ncbi:aminopeptidase N [Saccharomonospora marina XMU15]|uniref:Aminopeptidase N n=1 Tax=Saccharomonospora marina XMU15 TaxID=882083 RepID=H5WXL5_9PSEU|nr:aminopeptidase N [Saccharomonospora marina]EHR50618.1 aminopeptidase N [Saccharomonospora marina XMU15]
MALEARATVRANLTQDEAAARSAEVTDVHYAVDLDLTAAERTFATSTVVRFQAGSGNPCVFLDFAGEVESVVCNGREIGREAHDGTRVRLDVRPGENTVRVAGTAPYSRTGEGLHRFQDSLDGQVYVHTKFEPFSAHLVFACFDQPDLKATVDLTVTVDDHWVVVTNTDPAERLPLAGGGCSTWRFERTPPLPPYLVAVAAGPFRRMRSSHNGVPLALYARESLLEELTDQAPELFDVISRGLDFYSELFDIPYPFAKYDHVFAPEYTFGGMEHPGCVTLNERFLFRHRVTEDKKRRRAELLMHEMAHMWFGDYVTMRWWDDLWLNEAFATMMSVVAQPEVTRYGEGWTGFAHHSLPVARHGDRLPTSHAIRVETADTEAARSNFGPIVYRKGAAALRNLAASLGWDCFVAGVRSYLRAHAWGNAGLDDFVAALRRVSTGDVDSWVDEWLLRRGSNTVQVSRLPAADRAVQLPDPDVPPRHLKLRFAGFDDHDGRLVLRQRAHLTLTPAECERELTVFGGRSPDLVLPNDDAVSPVKVRLDPRSRLTALRILSTLDDPRARAVVWGALWDDVLDARLPARSYASAVLAHGVKESDVGVVEALLERAVQAVRVYGDPSSRCRMLADLARQVRDQLVGAAAGGDRQLVLARTLVDTVQADGHDLLRELVCGRCPWPGLEVDRDLRWRALLRLASNGGDIDGLLDVAMQADPGDSGRRNALTVQASRPDPAAKEQAWTRLFSDGFSLVERKAVMAGMRQPVQEALLTPYAERYLQALRSMAGAEEAEFWVAFARELYPRFTTAEQSVLAGTDALLGSRVLPENVHRVVSEERTELIIMRAARACDTANRNR